MLGCIQPMSSPMMNRMLGLPAGVCATAAVAETSTAAARGAYRKFRNFITRLREAGMMLSCVRALVEHQLRPAGRTELPSMNQSIVLRATHWTLDCEYIKARSTDGAASMSS